MSALRRPELPDIHCEILILGGGFAGLNLAKELASTNKTIYVLGSPYDSQVAKGGIIEWSENIPSTEVGLKYIEQLMDEVKALGVILKTSLATSVNFDQKPLLVSTKWQKFFTEHLIISTGAKQKRFGFPGESEFYHKGISDCAVCDANLFKEKSVAIIGNHRYTIKSARYLQGLVGEVSLLWLDSEMEDDLRNKLGNFPSDHVYLGVESLEVFGSEYVEGVRFNNEKGNHVISVEAAFIEGEPVPNSTLFVDTLKLGVHDEIVVNENFQTSHAQVYALGDVTGILSGVDEVLSQVSRLAKILVERLD